MRHLDRQTSHQAAIAAALVAFAGAARAAAPFAASFEAYATPPVPVAVAVADLNGDGWPEIVTANVFTSTVTVLLGDRSEPYAASNEFGVGIAPQSVLLAHLDGDAHLDLVTANYLSQSITVLRGGGDARFPGGLSYLTPLLPLQVRAADVDGDGWQDLVTFEENAASVPGEFGVFLNRGDGTFGARRAVAASGVAVDFALGDVNGDGYIDLVEAVTDPNRVSIHAGAGDGTFPARTDRPLGGRPYSLALARLDADARLDIAVAYEKVVANVFVYPIEIALGAPGGFVSKPDVFVEGNVRFLGSDDVDGDGDGDLLVVTHQASVVYGNGDGTFTLRRFMSAGVDPQTLVAADLDADGDRDLVGAAPGTGAVTVMRQRGDGSFGPEPVYTTPLPIAVVVRDFDADGKLDFAVTSAQSDAVSVHRGLGDGGFAPRQESATAPEPTCLAAADMDGDGVLDLVTTTFDEQRSMLTFLRGTGDGGFAPRLDHAIGFPATCIATGDFDGDSHLDVAATLWSADWPNDASIGIYLGRGDGTFDDAPRVAVPPLPWALEVADLDGDGRDDVAVTYRRSTSALAGGVAILLGRGDGGFEPRQEILVGIEPRGLTAGDVDADGDMDLVVANSAFAVRRPGSVSVLLGTGGGAFDVLPEISLAAETQDVALVHVDADPHLDLVAVNAGANSVSVLFGWGDGGFGGRADLGVGTRPLFVDAGDLNGDARPDLVVPHGGAASVSVLVNTTLTTAVTVESFEAWSVPEGVRVGWRIASPARRSLRGVQLERSTNAPGSWVPISPLLPPEHEQGWLDADPGTTRRGYRLRLETADGRVHFTGPLDLEARAASETRLAPPRVGTHEVLLRFQLQHAATFRLAIHDARGRRLWTHAARGVAGAHLRAWDRTTSTGEGVARGVYWARLEVEGRSWSQRFVLVGK